VAKLILMKKNEVSVPEEKKGKQIAVKEANIISLNSFYVQNYQPPVESVEPVQDEIQAAPMEEINPEPIIEQPTLDNNIINVEPSMEIVEEPLIQEEPVNAIEPQQESVIESPVIDLAVDNQVEDTKMDEEMDPELQEIKDKYGVKIVDVINPTIDYIKKNNLTKVGILGTYMTVDSKVFENRLTDVKQVACPKFVPAIESGKSVDEYAKEYLEQLKTCENIVLGCTHYPLIIDTLKKYKNVNFINMGKCIAEIIDFNNEVDLQVDLYFSKVDENLKHNVKQIVGEFEIKEI